MWLISYNGEKQMTFLLIIIVTLNSNPCLFHYKSFVIFYCFYMIILSCKTESKLRYSKKTSWPNHHFIERDSNPLVCREWHLESKLAILVRAVRTHFLWRYSLYCETILEACGLNCYRLRPYKWKTTEQHLFNS